MPVRPVPVDLSDVLAERRGRPLDQARTLPSSWYADPDHLEICEAVQRTCDGGLSADGVLSTEHEAGIHHVHQLLYAALDPSD